MERNSKCGSENGGGKRSEAIRRRENMRRRGERGSASSIGRRSGSSLGRRWRKGRVIYSGYEAVVVGVEAVIMADGGSVGNGCVSASLSSCCC
jgi:hypothetical protein